MYFGAKKFYALQGHFLTSLGWINYIRSVRPAWPYRRTRYSGCRRMVQFQYLYIL